MKILVIEDELALLEEINQFLLKEEYVVETANAFDIAEDKIAIYHYDITIVDITLPGGSGLELIQNLKKRNSDTGILIISAKNSLDDKLTGLDIGADDYITKPFHLAELNARIKALIRRRYFKGAMEVSFNEIRINSEEKTVFVNDAKLTLTKKEYALIAFFIANKNRLITKESIAEHLWGDHIDLVDNFDFIYTHINNLRKKIEAAGGTDYLRTVYGMGYKFTDR
ncbi:MAG TPA: response regulator transcription factor [Bacteroidales bacterium]|nr:response regulator transcription factor [Bacteroidales bacterium]HRW97474.1 response regulator transcription factor [Bacteroidales bacterium]